MLRSAPLSYLLGGLLLFVGAGVVTNCDVTSTESSEDTGRNCSIDTDHLREGAERGSIVALSNPKAVGPESEAVSDLRDDDRVIALLGADPPLAVPRKLLNQHEIVNLEWNDRSVAITHCPLTVSSLAFDRSVVDGAKFGVSGLLFHNNLVMFDKREDQSLWPQMSRRATCGSSAGTSMEMVPVLDLRWEHWRTLHPDTRVLPVRVSGQNTRSVARNAPRPRTGTSTGQHRKQSTPSGLVLGLPGRGQIRGDEGPKVNSGGIAFPFRRLATDTGARVVRVSSGTVLFWSQDARTAMVYESSSRFLVDGGQILDEDTGSVWTIEGRAVEGPRKGDQLRPVSSAYVALWSAWSNFNPETNVWAP